MFRSIRRDIERLKRRHPSRAKAVAVMFTNRGLQAIILYRLSHALWKCHIPLLPMILSRIAQTLFAVDIDYHAELGPGIVIVHGFGLVIGRNVRIAGDCCLFHGVTLGDRGSEWVSSARTDGHPVVEKEVMFGAGAKVLGPIHIGCNSVIGANSVVIKDVPPHSIAAGVPAKVIGQRPVPDEWRETETREAAHV